MSDTEFTPGPWKWTENSASEKGNECIEVFQGEGSEYSPQVCYLQSCYRGSAETIADAHLIASAPDIYKALEDLLDRYVGLVECGDCGNWDAETEEEVIASRTALTKARGE